MKDQQLISEPKFDELKVVKNIRKQVAAAMYDFNMVEEGDKVMVCLSGGKDSYTMLDLLMYIKKVAPFNFDIVAVNLDQKQPDFPEHILPEYLEQLGVEYKILEQDTYSVVMEKLQPGKTMCSLCSRMRRGALYAYYKEIGVTKMALGHHREDIVETLFLNMFFSSKMETMPPKYLTDNGEHIVIRPLAYCKEAEIEEYSQLKEFPIIPCNLCGSQDGLKRQEVKKMLADWEEQYPGRVESIFNSMKKIAPSHMMDQDLWDFKGIEVEK